MRSLIINCTLKPSPAPSNTEAPAGVVADALRERGVETNLGWTFPAQAWTYWHLGPGPGPDYLDEQKGHEWAHSTARTMAANLHHVASALAARPWPTG